MFCSIPSPPCDLGTTCAFDHEVPAGDGRPQKMQHGHPSQLSRLATFHFTSMGISSALALLVCFKQAHQPLIVYVNPKVSALVHECRNDA